MYSKNDFTTIWHRCDATNLWSSDHKALSWYKLQPELRSPGSLVRLEIRG